MSLPALEKSRYSGEPINLFLFQYGDLAFEYFGYTDAEDPVTYTVPNDDGDDETFIFTPIAIDRGKITSSGTLDKSNMTVSTAINTELARLYLIYPPSSVTTLIMFQGHINDDAMDFRVVWTGRVLSCARKGSQAEFTCEPVSTALRRKGLRRRYQYGCPHPLYGVDCRASEPDATSPTQVIALTRSRVTIRNDWGDVARAVKYVQGMAKWIGEDGSREIRTILRAENGGYTFLLSGTTRGLVVGSTINLILGCNHKSGTDAQPDGDCGPLHNNILNFGGQERIPLKNPLGFVNQFY